MLETPMNKKTTLSYGAFAIFGLLALTGCPDKPPADASADAIAFTPDPTVQWLIGAPATLNITATMLASGQPVVYIPGKCPNLKLEDVNTNLPNHLASLGNSLSGRDAPASYSSKWITAPAEINDFRVSLVANEAVENAAGGFSYASSFKMEANQSYESGKFLLTIGKIARKVSLTTDAAGCVKASVCVATDNKGGSAVSAVYYGALIRLNIKTGAFSAGANVNVADYAKLSFDFKSESIDVQGGLIGSLAQPDEIKNKYDVDKILVDLKAHNIITVSDKINKMAEKYGLVAVDTMTISGKDCKLISGVQ